MKGLGREEGQLEELPVEWSILTALRKRVDLATEVDAAQHRLNKEAYDDGWLRRTAEAAEIGLDEDEDDNDSDDEEGRSSRTSKKKKRRSQAIIEQLKALLDDELRKPLSVRGVSSKYITSNNQHEMLDRLLNSKGWCPLFPHPFVLLFAL